MCVTPEIMVTPKCHGKYITNVWCHMFTKLLKTTQHTSHHSASATNYKLTQSISWTLRQCLTKQRFNCTLAIWGWTGSNKIGHRQQQAELRKRVGFQSLVNHFVGWLLQQQHVPQTQLSTELHTHKYKSHIFSWTNFPQIPLNHEKLHTCETYLLCITNDDAKDCSDI